MTKPKIALLGFIILASCGALADAIRTQVRPPDWVQPLGLIDKKYEAKTNRLQMEVDELKARYLVLEEQLDELYRNNHMEAALLRRWEGLGDEE